MNQSICKLVGLLGLVASAAGQERGPRPNILFIFSDDHAYQAISAYGSRVNQTPNIDRLAREGLLFRNCFVTNSICGPSRAVILTGKYSHLNGMTVNGPAFDGSQVTFPKLLRAAGYETAIVGKWHLKSDPTGFDHWEVLIGQGPYYNPTLIRNGERKQHEGYTTDLITDHALEWLRGGRDRDKPFLLMFQHKAPHRRWLPNLKHLHLYDDVNIPEPETLFDDYATRGTAAHTQDMTIAVTMDDEDLKLVTPGELNDEQRKVWEAAYGPKNAAFRAARLEGRELVRWKYQRYLKDYLRCVASLDENIGRVLEYLDEAGLAENTLVVYSSDQGFYLGEHGWFDKRFMYEPSLRTPLVARWPKEIRAGQTCDAFVSNLDLAQTFLDVAGVKAPPEMQGASLRPLLAGATPADWRKSFYYHYYEFPGWHSVRKHYGVRGERYKLIHFYELDEWELYDLASDPQELRNLYGEPSQAENVQRLKRELERLRRAYRDETD